MAALVARLFQSSLTDIEVKTNKDLKSIFIYFILNKSILTSHILQNLLNKSMLQKKKFPFSTRNLTTVRNISARTLR